MKTLTCSLDILPSSLFKNVIGSNELCVLSIINNSLLSGRVPAYFKQAVIQRLLKKSDNDNYRYISKVPFLAKVLQPVLTTVLDKHNIFDKFQSGFCRLHSTGTALLRVSNDILM